MVALNLTVPVPQFSPDGIGVPETFWVVIVPGLVIVVGLPASANVTKSKIQPELLLMVPPIESAPPAVCVPLVLPKFTFVYVPAGMVCPPVVASNVIVPFQVSPDEIGVADVFWVRIVPPLVMVVMFPAMALVCILRVPPAVVVSVPVTVRFPAAV